MRPSEFLRAHGWRQIGGSTVNYGAKYWDHRQHQPDRHGAFTTLSAEKHQQEYMKNGWCDCLKEDRR